MASVSLDIIEGMRRKQDFPARAEDLDPAPGDLGILQAADVEPAVEVREALRAFLVANSFKTWPTGGAAEQAVERLDRVSSRTPIVVRFAGAGETRLEPDGHGFKSALGRLFSIVAAARLERRPGRREWARTFVVVGSPAARSSAVFSQAAGKRLLTAARK